MHLLSYSYQFQLKQLGCTPCHCFFSKKKKSKKSKKKKKVSDSSESEESGSNEEEASVWIEKKSELWPLGFLNLWTSSKYVEITLNSGLLP